LVLFFTLTSILPEKECKIFLRKSSREKEEDETRKKGFYRSERQKTRAISSKKTNLFLHGFAGQHCVPSC